MATSKFNLPFECWEPQNEGEDVVPSPDASLLSYLHLQSNKLHLFIQWYSGFP